MPYYAVAKGRSTGVYESWGECRNQVDGYSGATFKKFDSAASAQDFVAGKGDSSSSNSSYGGYSSNQSYGSSYGYSGHHSDSFERDSDGYVEVFTDGACSSNGRDGAKAGIGVYWGDGHPLNTSESVSGRHTNNSGEIQAATRAMKQAAEHGVKNLKINTDSKFLIKSATEWMPVLGVSSKMPFYAVAKGRSVGVYETWAECEAQVKGFSGARYKKFDSASSAQDFISAEGGTSYPSKLKLNQSYVNNAAATTKYNQKRSLSTASSSHQTNGKSRGSNSQKKSQAWKESAESDEGSLSDDLDTVLSKQMDDIEKRLKTFERGVDKIEKKGSKNTRGVILIEPPLPKRARKNNSEFEEDSEGYVQVYTDGACSANGRSGARAGIGVFWGDDHHLNISEPVSGRATNNCGEIQAATCAMKQAIDNGFKNLTINTDSQFLINSVTKWMAGWKRKGWKLASGESVKNEKDFKELDSLLHQLNVKWNYVEAHRGVYGNEKADELAKAGAAMYQI